MRLFHRKQGPLNGVTVFGSAARFVRGGGGNTPRNINAVFYGDTSQDDAIRVVQHWAIDNNLGALPVDEYRVYRYHGNEIWLHTPVDMNVNTITIMGHEPKVRWYVHNELPALLRLSAVDVSAAYGHIAQMLRPASHKKLGIDLVQKSGHDWESETSDCLRALANALARTDEDFLDSLGVFGRFLADLKSIGHDLPNSIRPDAVAQADDEQTCQKYVYWWFKQPSLDAPVMAYNMHTQQSQSLDELLERIIAPAKQKSGIGVVG